MSVLMLKFQQNDCNYNQVHICIVYMFDIWCETVVRNIDNSIITVPYKLYKKVYQDKRYLPYEGKNPASGDNTQMF